MPKRKPLTVEQILAWADGHHARTGRWPGVGSGEIRDSGGENWFSIHQALYVGGRGLPGGSSLRKLLLELRGPSAGRSCGGRLSVEQILAWADEHYSRTGQWPLATSGAVFGANRETWRAIESALRRGNRGLPGNQSLSLLLWRHREVRPRTTTEPLSIEQILTWADQHRRRTGQWPNRGSGKIADAQHETWQKVDDALCHRRRGLRGTTTLARLLRKCRGVSNHASQRGPLSEEQILAWADRYHARHGKWPDILSGPIAEEPGEKWSAIDYALRVGSRGLPGKDSLCRLLARNRGVTAYGARAPLTVEAILRWADGHFNRTGRWPYTGSGEVTDKPSESWARIDQALRVGCRGLRGGTTLAKLLHKHRGAPRRGSRRPLLTVDRIAAWINAYHYRTGKWPKAVKQPVLEAPDETWRHLDYALRRGRRGLRGRQSLSTLVVRCRMRDGGRA